MSATAAAALAIVGALAVSLPFYFTTRHLNKKQWEWEKTGKYLREMNHVSLVIAIALFIIFFLLLFGIVIFV